MLRKIRIENFMSLRDATVDLEPLTVLIGVNAAGKSAVFKALVTLGKLQGSWPLRGPRGEFQLEPGVTLDHLVWSGNTGLPIRFSAWFDPDPKDDPDYFLELRKGPAGWGVAVEKLHMPGGSIEVNEATAFQHPTESRGIQTLQPPLRATLRHLVHPYLNDSLALPALQPIVEAAEALGQTYRYRPSAWDIAAPVPALSGPQDRPFVRENGRGLGLVLQELQGSDRDQFTSIESDLSSLFPHIRRIGLKTDYQGVRLTFFTDRSNEPILASQESDGVLLATFILWRLRTAAPQIRVCLEEPEAGLHPSLLGARYELLHQFAYPTAGQTAVQILVATHSYQLLRTIKSHHTTLFKQIRVVTSDPTAGTSVRTPAHYPDVARAVEVILSGEDARPTDA